jgi:hypothetical protein
VDPDEEFIERHNKDKPSGFFAEFPVSKTGRVTNITEANPTTGTTYTQRTRSSQSYGSSSNNVSIRTPRQRKTIPSSGESKLGNFIDYHNKTMSDWIAKGKVKIKSARR